MNSLLLLKVVPFVLLAAAIIFFFRRLHSDRTHDDLKVLLRHVDIRIAEDLCDPAEEARLRSALSTAAFRAQQQKRMAGLTEIIGRISHNGAIFLDWGNHEYQITCHKNRSLLDERDHLILRVIDLASDVRKHALAAKVKLSFWRLLTVIPFFPVPSLAELREVKGKDLLQIYELLAAASGQLSLTFGVDQYDAVMAAL